MSESKFTPGPWHIDNRGSHGIEVGTYFRANPTMFNSLAEKIDTQANANLIAAAPDMYDVCKSICKSADEALIIMKREGFVIDNLDDRWQKLAFTLYSAIVSDAVQSEYAIVKADGLND